MEKVTGTVKWYNPKTGYGFIFDPRGDLFFHNSDIQMPGFRTLADGQLVSYSVVPGDNNKGLKAVDIVPLEQSTARRAARYRYMLCGVVKTGMLAALNALVPPPTKTSWWESWEKDNKLRISGVSHLNDIVVVHVESDRPHQATMSRAKSNRYWAEYQAWEKQVNDCLFAPLKMMEIRVPSSPAASITATSTKSDEVTLEQLKTLTHEAGTGTLTDDGTLVTTVTNCSACNGTHTGMVFSRCEKPIDGFTHQAPCPKTKKIVYVKVLGEDEPAPKEEPKAEAVSQPKALEAPVEQEAEKLVAANA